MSDKNYKLFLNYLNLKKVNIDKSEFKLQLEGHPDYPSLLSFSDTLHFFNIDNNVYRIDNENVYQIPKHSLAIANDDLVLLENKNNILYINGKRDNDFLSKWDNIVFVVENQIQIKTNFKVLYKNLFLGIMIMFFLLLIRIEPSFLYTKIIFIISSFIGLLFALEAYKKTHGKGTFVPIGVCKNEILKTDCDFVFNSQRWKVFNYFDLSEISIVFFAIQIITFIFFTLSASIDVFFNIFKYGLLLFIPIGLASIYYQILIVKKLCPICIVIIICVFIQLYSLHVIFLPFAISLNQISLFVLAIFIVIATLYNLKIKNRYVQKIEDENKYSIRFRRNFEFFKNNLLTQNELSDMNFTDAFRFGNNKTSLSLLLVTNPFCKHCKDFYPVFFGIIEKFPNIEINIILDANIDKYSEEMNLVYIDFACIYLNAKDKKEFPKALNEWYTLHDANNTKEIWYDKYSKYINSNRDEAIRVLKSHRIWCNNNEVYFTPNVFINGFQYPIEYKRNELEYFVAEMLDNN